MYIPLTNVNYNNVKHFFFTSAITEQNNLDFNIRHSESLALFLLKTFYNSTSHCRNPEVLKLNKRLELGLSHLRFHKVKHSFHDTLNLIYSCGTAETTIHYLLHCPNFSNETLFNNLHSIDKSILSKDDSKCFPLANTHLMVQKILLF